MKKGYSLQGFLIRKFMIILLLVTITEYIITHFVNQIMMPVVIKNFLPEINGKLDAGEYEIGLFVMAIILILIFHGIASVFPPIARAPVEWIVDRINGGIRLIIPSIDRKDVYTMHLDKMEAFCLFMVMLALAVLILLPYIIGALVYARIVIVEFRKIQQEKEQTQREFSRKRNLMLSDIAHDLRTPMTTVTGYAKALTDGMVKEENQQEYLNAIQNKCVRMNELINVLFEYVKLDSEGFTLNKKTVDLCELLRENAALIYSDVEDAGMELEIDIPENQIKVSADSIQFSRVITNLLINAIRHNEGKISIGLFLEQDIDQIRIYIADSGKIISEEQAGQLFEPFAMGDQSRNSGGGSGLGLSIAKKIVEMHGWKIKLVQQPQIKNYAKVSNYIKTFVIIIYL